VYSRAAAWKVALNLGASLVTACVFVGFILGRLGASEGSLPLGRQMARVAASLSRPYPGGLPDLASHASSAGKATVWQAINNLYLPLRWLHDQPGLS